MQQEKNRARRIAHNLEDEIRKSDGFLTKQGKLLNLSEWHVLFMGGGQLLGAYTTPRPLPSLFIFSYFLILYKVTRESCSEAETLKEISRELPYYLGSALAVHMIFQLLGHELPPLDLLISLTGGR